MISIGRSPYLREARPILHNVGRNSERLPCVGLRLARGLENRSCDRYEVSGF